jgi:hypothetical protein
MRRYSARWSSCVALMSPSGGRWSWYTTSLESGVRRLRRHSEAMDSLDLHGNTLALVSAAPLPPDPTLPKTLDIRLDTRPPPRFVPHRCQLLWIVTLKRAFPALQDGLWFLRKCPHNTAHRLFCRSLRHDRRGNHVLPPKRR